MILDRDHSDRVKLMHCGRGLIADSIAHVTDVGAKLE